MEIDAPLKIEIFSSNRDGDQHRIVSAKEIKFVLHHIAKKESHVALYYGDMSDFILVTLLGVDDNGLWLEQSQDDTHNQRVIESSKLTFVSLHLQVKVQFTAHQVSGTEYRGYRAFYLPLPESIYRVQRREYYRLPTPEEEPLRCIIPTGEPHVKKLREVIVMDISGGGVGLTCAETDTDLVPGETYTGCTIELPGVGKITCTIEVRNLTGWTTPSGHTYKRAGCAFKNLDGQSNIMLQRYVTNVQRARNKTPQGVPPEEPPLE